MTAPAAVWANPGVAFRAMDRATYRCVLNGTLSVGSVDQNSRAWMWLQQRDALTEAQREIHDALLREWRGPVEDLLEAARRV